MEKESAFIRLNTQLDEKDVGILEYFNPTNKGFECILKHRFTDFLVNEIDLNGNVIWGERKNLDKINELNQQAEFDVKHEKKEYISKKQDLVFDTNNTSHFKDLISSSDLESFKKYLEDIQNNTINNKFMFVDLMTDKAKRKDFHEKVRLYFSFLDSTTDSQKNKIKITLQNQVSTHNKRRPPTQQTEKDPEQKKYLRVTLLKRNLDTSYVINYLSRYIGKSNKMINFAGNKDKRGITTQDITIFNISKDQLEKFYFSKLFDNRVELSNFQYTDNDLRLGMLTGNQFSVMLRFINKDLTNDYLNECVQSLKNGFINYFGMQRFGSGNSPTHLIGKELINANWKRAVAMILQGKDFLDAINYSNIELSNKVELSVEDIEVVIANTDYVNLLLINMNKKAHTENVILTTLKKAPNNFYNSYKALSRNLRLLYLHAYQSYIWNLTASYRIKEFGKVVIEGDLVLKDKTKLIENTIEVEENDDDSFVDDKNMSIDDFIIVNKSNMSSYTLDDVYLPLFGKSIMYPSNAVGDYIKKLTDADGIDLSSILIGPGTYRKLVQIPQNVTHDIIFHDEQDIDLQNEYYNKKSHPKVEGNKFKSLRFQFQVPQSTYATMVFRELTKQSSSFSNQMTMTEKIL